MATKKASTSKGRKTTKTKQSQLKQQQERRARVRREAIGVGLIALGLLGLLSISPIEMGVLGAGIKNLLFGLLGFAAFVIPAGTIAIGVLVILAQRRQVNRMRVACVAVLAVLLLIFGHLLSLEAFDRTSFQTFYADGFRVGRLQGMGTGAIGAILTYPIVLMVGKVGAYIFTVALALCCLLVLTRLSLTQVGEQTVKAARSTASLIERKTQEQRERVSQLRREREEQRALYESEQELPPQDDGYSQPDAYSEPVAQIFPQRDEPPRREMPEQPDIPPMQSFTYDLYQEPQPKPAVRPAVQAGLTGAGTGLRIILGEDSGARLEETARQPVLEPTVRQDPVSPAGSSAQDGPALSMEFGPKDAPKAPAELPKWEHPDEPAEDRPTVQFASSGSFEAPEAPENPMSDSPAWYESFEQPAAPKAPAQRPEKQAAGPGPVFVVAPPTQVTKDDSMTIEPEENADKGYRYPVLSLLNPPKVDPVQGDPQEEMSRGAKILEETLASFNIKAKVVHVTRGPAITRYELTPAPGVKVSRITSLTDDIALNLAAYGVRIEAPIPGKQAVGIEVPNRETATVTLRETLDNDGFFNHKSGIVAAIGKDIAGQVVLCDLAKMPHVLIAGATGSGKSVCINTIIASILYKSSPDEVKFIMIDPKVVELNVYNGIPHLLIPVVTDPKKASGALGWAVQEMTDRYKKFADMHVKDITSYNAHAQKQGLKPMPKIVIIIDELADLMAVAPGEVEERVQRLAQLARAAGMHLVIATQRPSVNVITGVIKANIPSRIAFAVASQVDSRTILDMAGAEKLLGRGDMLYYPAGLNKPVRVQGAFISEDEVEALVEYIKDGEEAQYNDEILESIEQGAEKSEAEQGESEVDPVLRDAIALAVSSGEVSISMLQRKLGVGYPRAGKLIDAMEKRGYISGHEGSKPRRVLISREEFERTFGETIDG